MGRTGVCWDNVGADSLWPTFKHEHDRHSYTHQSELVVVVDNWFNHYNTARRHSKIVMLSPIDYEMLLTADFQAAQPPSITRGGDIKLPQQAVTPAWERSAGCSDHSDCIGGRCSPCVTW
jgi:hypothetical protein